jgi:hypothetical protein
MPFERVAKRLFAHAFEGAAQGGLGQFVFARDDLRVVLLPVQIFLPAVRISAGTALGRRWFPWTSAIAAKRNA